MGPSLAELLACGGACLAVDQVSKHLVARRVGDRSVSCGPLLTVRTVLSLQRVYEHKRAGIVMLLTWCAALASAIVLTRSGAWFQSHAAQWGLAAAFGGAAGNLLDMLRRRGVLDFIDLRWWPIFNLADVAIVGGLLLAFWRS